MIPNRLIRESQMQASLFAEIDLRANQDPRFKYIFHVPNGGARDKRTAAILKTHGVRKGVVDILWLIPAHGYHGLAMELKTGGNKVEPEQSDWLAFHKAHGYYTCIVRDDAGKAMEILNWYCSDEDGDE